MTSPTNPLIALTYDDGPEPVNTPRILDILDEEDVKATFFITGENALAHPTIVQRIHDEGHVIGNHSYSHANFTTLSDTFAYNEILGTNQIIEQITGVVPTLFRYPFGISSSSGEQAIAALGMTGGVMWHWDHFPSEDYNDGEAFTGDWIHANTTRAMTDYVIGNAVDDALILLHDGLDASGAPAQHFDYLQPAIRILKSDGFAFGIVAAQSDPNPVNRGSRVKVELPTL